jgi:aminopeptidase N
VVGTRKAFRNHRPIIGHYNVNHEGSGDMYYKGANMLHTLRQLIEDDEKWRKILRKMNVEFYHKTVTTQQIESFLSKETGIDLTEFFNQYLRTVKIPTLEYEIKKKILKYRWTNCVEGFDMPIQVKVNGEEKWIFPKGVWSDILVDSKINTFEIDLDFYIASKKL